MKKTIIAGCILLFLLGAWVLVNPPGRFGYCFFGLTVYSAWPHPGSDIEIRSDGRVRTVEKTHDLRLDAIQWLLDPEPEVLIIATGWRGLTQVDPVVESLPGIEVKILKSGKALDLFNRLKAAGKQVAIHYHATC